jgi:hypothetical protein
VTAAVRTVLDALLRSFRQPVPEATGPGLRGGTFHVDYRARKVTLELRRSRWVEDVAVSGSATGVYATGSLKGNVTVRGAGTERGKLKFSGIWNGGGLFRDFKVRGTIGDRTIAVTVPAN